jgi:o-succinylbenzoate synthase
MVNEKTFQFGQKLKIEYLRRDLIFRKKATTSRDTLHSRPVWYVKIFDDNNAFGLGEIAPLSGLSLESIADVEFFLNRIHSNGLDEADFLESTNFPSIRMGLEMALIQLKSGKANTWFPGKFSEGNSSIPINGLVWMNDCETMLNDAIGLVELGFTCIKFKVGAQNFREEVKMLEAFRTTYPSEKISIRLDANGAFSLESANEKLKQLKQFHIHSIEQPVAPVAMLEFANSSEERYLPLALDEQLIGSYTANEKKELLEHIKPDFLVLKPTLLGGFMACEEWISLANGMDIGWWVTSMLESNIALTAIAEWTDLLNCSLPQGLGTGSLYTNNIPSSLYVQAPVLKSDPTVSNSFNEIFTL